MKFCTFEIATPLGPVQRVGAAVGTQVVDLAAAYYAWLTETEQASPAGAARQAAALIPTDMVHLLENGDTGMTACQQALEYASGAQPECVGVRLCYAAGDVRLRAPVPRPPMLRDCMCFEGHLRDSYSQLDRPMPSEWYETPVYYKGNIAAISGPEDDVIWPGNSRIMDFEVELAAVIGRRARNIAPEAAERYIAGYTILNDFSARDVQKQEMAVGLGPAVGKDFDGSNVLGPWLVTPDELGTPGQRRFAARVNGETWVDVRNPVAYWPLADMIAYISRTQTLSPGDVIAWGTIPGGCGLEHGRYLRDGDVVELEVEGIGVLRNRVRRSNGTPRLPG